MPIGRLIRRPSDRGVCVILDPRVARARYGGAFRAVLPGKPQPVDSPQALRGAVRDWFASSRGESPPQG